jgi:hypothetical protein
MLQATATIEKTLDNFRGDFSSLAAFINGSWAVNYEQPLQYRPEFLKSCFEYPGASTHLAPTIYSGTEPGPIAFVAAFPRAVTLEGRLLKIALVTFLTVDSAHKKKGYGVALWSELVSRLRNSGFDGMVNYCVAGSPMDQMIVGCCQRITLPTACIYSIGYMSALLPPNESRSWEPARENPEQMVSSFLRVSRQMAQNASLARVWGEDEARWQCERRHDVIAANMRDAKDCGVLTGYLSPIANEKQTKCLFVEDVLWPDLDENERKLLLHTFLDRARSAGAEMATVPRCGYADLKAFTSAGFIRTRRVMRAYLSLWNGMPVPASLSSFYLDIL